MPTVGPAPAIGQSSGTQAAAPASPTKAQAHAPAVPAKFLGGWTRHSTQFDIRADGTGKVSERAYTPCGTSQDCAFNASLTITRTAVDEVAITYSRVWFTGDNDAVMTLSAADHKALDPYFPLVGERATATVDAGGRLVVTYTGPFVKVSQRSAEANTYCGKSTVPGQTGPCGA